MPAAQNPNFQEGMPAAQTPCRSFECWLVVAIFCTVWISEIIDFGTSKK
jgi:hypothetical protein